MGGVKQGVACVHSSPQGNHPGTTAVGPASAPSSHLNGDDAHATKSEALDNARSQSSIPELSTAYKFAHKFKDKDVGKWGTATVSIALTIRGSIAHGDSRHRLTASLFKYEARESLVRFGRFEVRARQNLEYGESKLKEKGASAGLELVIEVYVGEAVLPFIIGFSVDVKDVLPALRFRADSPAINTDQLIKLYQTENLSTSLKEPGWFRLTPELSVRGTIQATLEVELKPKADSLAYSAAYRGLGRAGQYLARVAFSEAACVVVGVVAVAVLVVAHIALGQIVISREKKGGSEEAIGFAFVSGYAEMLAQLTDPEDSARGLGRLLDLDWVELFNNQAGLYLYYTTMGARETLVASEAARLEIQRCGRAAVAQDWMKFVKDNDGEKAWGVLRKHFNPRGASTAELKRTFLRLLDDQVSEHGKLRIEFPPAKKAAATSDEK